MIGECDQAGGAVEHLIAHLAYLLEEVESLPEGVEHAARSLCESPHLRSRIRRPQGHHRPQRVHDDDDFLGKLVGERHQLGRTVEYLVARLRDLGKEIEGFAERIKDLAGCICKSTYCLQSFSPEVDSYLLYSLHGGVKRLGELVDFRREIVRYRQVYQTGYA